MAVPPLAALATSFRTYPQLKRSFYIFVFQTPLAETAVSLDGHAFIDGLWADWSPGYDASFDVARVKEAIGARDNLTAAIGYYRAMFDPTLHDAAYADAQAATAGMPPQPTLYLHGADDGCLARDAVGDVLPFLSPRSKQVTVAGAGHFLQVEQPDTVNDHVLRFIGSP
jgi:pimeloyl-ACP methyl ester carboxylesterase